jgi:uncharacterized protein (DUF362 family)/Pyruvate/2-oxoacid:ferredoxin oxidoreductase delta subunit
MDRGVALVECPDYSKNAIQRAVDGIVDALSLWNGVLPDSEKVLLKPNLLTASHPDKAIVTHPALVGVVARRLRQKGYMVFVGDSPGGAIKGVERYWEKTGLKEAARDAGARLVNFESSGWERITRNGREYTIARPVLDFQFILNMPKLKSHVYAGLTGAVKNMYGSMPGLSKTAMHLEAPKPKDFAARLLDIYEIAAPSFHIADAVVVIDTKGPSSGRIRPMDCLLASSDGVALDALFARLVGCPVGRYLTGAEAKRRGYPGVEMKNIQVKGGNPSVLAPRDFKVANIAPFRFIPGFLGPVSERLVRSWPVSTGGCTGCGFCAESCPVKAIEIKDQRAFMDTRTCILCLCCHELCPEGAVEMKRSFVARRLFRR